MLVKVIVKGQLGLLGHVMKKQGFENLWHLSKGKKKNKMFGQCRKPCAAKMSPLDVLKYKLEHSGSHGCRHHSWYDTAI